MLIVLQIIPAIIAAIIAATAGAAIVYLAIITFASVVDWFRARRALKASNRDHLAFTLREKLETGKFKVVQGIFNTESGEVVDARAMMGDELDDAMSDQHSAEDLVVYQ